MFKNYIRQFYRSLLTQKCQEYNPINLEKKAIIFSPHQDDETLGCGGTIIRKKQAGAEIKIVFMTDGSGSHAHLIPGEKLKQIRKKEALAAAEVLGVAAADVIFLDIQDGTLKFNQQSVIPDVIDILRRETPAEIYIPYAQEEPDDHWVTHRVVMSALQQYPLNSTLYEYPIWFWRQWPWTSLTGRPREQLSFLKNTGLSGLGLAFLRDFKCCVDITDVLQQKRTALHCHQSQVTRLLNDSRWMTLGDLSNGEFLDCFFQKFEFFHQSNVQQLAGNKLI